MAVQNSPQTPEGRLIEEAAQVSGRSARSLAANAGISDTRWRQVVKGSQPGPGGTQIPVTAPPLTLARMARAVGLTAEDLERVGRKDAADVVRDLTRRPKPVDRSGSRADIPDEIELIYSSKSMSAQEKLDAIRRVLHLRQQAEGEASASAETSPWSESTNNHA